MYNGITIKGLTTRRKMPLNEQQSAAVELALDTYKAFLNDDKDRDGFTLLGGGGVGKTFTCKYILEKILEFKEKIEGRTGDVLVIAPTNDAKAVIKEAMQDFKTKLTYLGVAIVYKTVASTLGKLPELDEKRGNLVFLEKELTKHPFDGVDIVVIEEGSMVAKEDFLKLHALALETNTQPFFIVLGDKYQHYPIGEKESYALNHFKDRFELLKIERQKGTILAPIIQHCREAVIEKKENFDIRYAYGDTTYDEERRGYYVFDDMGDAIYQSSRAVAKMIREKLPFLFRYICYRNDTCRQINTAVRFNVFKEIAGEDFLIGEYLHCRKPVTEKKKICGKWFDATVIDNGATVEIISKEEKEFTLTIQLPAKKGVEPEIREYRYKGYEIIVEECRYNVKKTIKLLTKSEQKIYEEDIKALRKECKEYSAGVKRLKTFNQERINASKNYWFYYMQLFNLVHDFDYAYAVTSHRVQGWSLKSVGVAIDDFVTIPDTESANRGLYVAISRAVENVLIG